MPRKSVVDLATRRPAVDISPPPKAHEKLSPAECKLWDNITGALPSDWFDAATEPLLLELVRAFGMSDLLYRQMRKAMSAEPLDMRGLSRLFELHDREVRRAVILATKLRLPHQARWKHPRTAGNAASKPPANRPRPWSPNDGA